MIFRFDDKAHLAFTALVLFLGLSTVGCPDDIAAEDGCEPRSIQACTCDDQTMGQRVCGEDQQLGPCLCGDDTGAGDTGSSDAEPGDAGVDSSATDTVLSDAAQDLRSDHSVDDTGSQDLVREDAIDMGTVDSASADVAEDTQSPDSSDHGLDQADASDLDGADTSDAGPTPSRIVYFWEETMGPMRLEAQEGSEAESLLPLLELLGTAEGVEDNFIAVSRNGEWVVIQTNRPLGDDEPNCLGWECLVVLDSNLTDYSIVAPRGVAVHPTQGWSTISNDGNTVVFAEFIDARQELWRSERNPDTGFWGDPVALTTESEFTNHSSPRFSWDEQTLIFECSHSQYTPPGTAICEVGIDGGGFTVLVRPEDFGEAGPTYALVSPDYLPDGRFVFGSDWEGADVWVFSRGGDAPVRFHWNLAVNGNRFPCTFADGSLAEMYLGGNDEDRHEIQIVSADGMTRYIVGDALDVFIPTNLSCAH